jgi:DNA-binding MarR family transcriptional regulator
MTLGEISQRMMVSNGNVTGLATRLEAEGLVERRARPGDRRAQLLRLTPRGRREFARQSAAHEAWIAGLLDGLQPEDRATLFRLLGRAKASVRAALTPEELP